MMMGIYVYDPQRIQLLYFQLPPHSRNPWTLALSLALEVPQIVMTLTVSYHVIFQLLFFHSCARDLHQISQDLL
jgi:hypothetical protein